MQLNEIHAAVSVKVYGKGDGRGPGGRRKYLWHRYDNIREMEPGERMMLYCSQREYGGYRTIVSRLKRDYGARFRTHYRDGQLTITREI